MARSSKIKFFVINLYSSYKLQLYTATSVLKNAKVDMCKRVYVNSMENRVAP